MRNDRRSFVLHSLALLGAGGARGFSQQNEEHPIVKTVATQDLIVAYEEFGPASGAPTVLLHGFPYDVRCFDRAVPSLVEAGRRVLVPYLRGYGPTKFTRASTPRVGQQAALGRDLLNFMNALHIPQAHLAGFDWGGRAACVLAALHPERVASLVSCGTGYNLQNTAKASSPASPDEERHHWYWFYFSTQRGEEALRRDPHTFCKYLWRTFSPTWTFSDDEYQRSSSSFTNPDFVAVVLHSYRYRIGAASGALGLQPIEEQISASPQIVVPAIVLEGADDGVDPPTPPGKTASHFANLRRQTVLDGIGHNVPQESPKSFAEAVLEVGS